MHETPSLFYYITTKNSTPPRGQQGENIRLYTHRGIKMDGMERKGWCPRLSMLEDPPCYSSLDLWVSAKAENDQVIELHTRLGEGFKTKLGVSECEIGRIRGNLSELRSRDVCVVFDGWEKFLLGLKKFEGECLGRSQIMRKSINLMTRP